MWGQGARCWEVNAKPGCWETLRGTLPESSIKREKHTTGLPDEALASENSCPQWKRDKRELRGGRSCFNQNNVGQRTTVQKLGEGTWGCLGYVCLFEIHHEFNRAGSKSWEQRAFRLRKAGLKHESIVEIPCSRITELSKVGRLWWSQRDSKALARKFCHQESWSRKMIYSDVYLEKPLCAV